MANPYASQCHTSARDKMGSVSGSPKNFESPYDKGQRFVGPDGATAPVPKKFAEGGAAHGDEKQDRKLFNKMFEEKEKGEK